MAERIGILTGGGDCPGLNAVIRAVTRRSLDRGAEVVGLTAGTSTPDEVIDRVEARLRMCAEHETVAGSIR